MGYRISLSLSLLAFIPKAIPLHSLSGLLCLKKKDSLSLSLSLSLSGVFVPKAKQNKTKEKNPSLSLSHSLSLTRSLSLALSLSLAFVVAPVYSVLQLRSSYERERFMDPSSCDVHSALLSSLPACPAQKLPLVTHAIFYHPPPRPLYNGTTVHGNSAPSIEFISMAL